MRNINKVSKFRSILTFAIILCILVSIMAVFSLKVDELFHKDHVDSPSYTLTTSSSTSSYGTFANKSTYTYTDKNKITTYRTGGDSDTTTVEIDSSADHGSVKNPYVIDNFNGWTKFVADMDKNSSSTYTYGQGKYYVLAVDLDFNESSAPIEKPIWAFGGTFFGLGHTISNWKYAEPETSTEEAVALFRQTFWGSNTEVIIADLNLDDYEITRAAKANASILANSFAQDSFVMNCHAKGKISREMERGSWVDGGGIVAGTRVPGTGYTYEVTMTVYRCSADFEFVVNDNTSNTVVFGGIAAYNDVYGNLNIYDCYANAVSDLRIYNNSTSTIFTGGILAQGIIGKVDGRGGVVRVENCVSKYVSNIPSNRNTTWMTGGSVVFEEYKTAKQRTTSVLNNVYSSATIYWTGAGVSYVHKIQPWSFLNSGGYNGSSNLMGQVEVKGDVYYTGEASADGVDGWGKRGNLVAGSNEGTLVNNDATGNGDVDLWNIVSNATALNGNIWQQKDKVGSAYTIQNSPVINKIPTKAFTISYKDVSADGESKDTLLGTSTYNYGSNVGLTLQSNKTGKIFKGYTFSRTSTANPFTLLPNDNYYGNLNLYAVWDVADSDVTKNITTLGGVEENGVIVADYGSTVTLSADIKCDAMGSDVEIEYEWRKSNEDNKVVGNGVNINITNVADSGIYSLYYKLHSNSEPLWGFDTWRAAGTKTVKINGKTPQFNESNFRLTSTAFIGMPMSNINCFAEFLDDSNAPFVGGEITWSGGANARIDKDTVTERDGKYYYKTQFTYTPDPSQNSAYVNFSPVTVDVEFEVEYASFVFKISGVNQPIRVNGIYGTRYTAQQIANDFEKEFLKNLAESVDPAYEKIKSMVPSFDGVKISDYRDSGADVVLEGNKEINVTFDYEDYNVVFNYVDENGDRQTHSEIYHYGDFLSMSWLDVPVGFVVNPWRFIDKEGVSRTWRFTADGELSADQVTGDVTLESEFKELKLTLDRLEITPRNSYKAKTILSGNNLTVIAHYKTDDGEDYPINLPSGSGINNSFKVTVLDSFDNALHCNANVIKISHTYDGKLLEEEITLNVTPIDVDFSSSGFENLTVSYGESYVLPRLKTIPDGIESVTYKYFRGSTEISIEDIVGDPDRNMTYTIRAEFVLESEDYYAEPISVQFVIRSKIDEPDIPINPPSGDGYGDGSGDDISSGDDSSGNVPTDPNPDDNGGIDPDKAVEFLKNYWREIASAISVILIIIFLAKTASNESKRRKAKRTVNEKYKTYYAASGVGMFGLSISSWTVIACVLMGLAVVSLAMMIISQIRRSKAERELESSREAYEQNKQDEMKNMFMRMMGGNGAQGGYVHQGLGADEMRGLISETVTALLPGMQQMLPQQASSNDELVQKLLEKEEKNDETINKLMEQNQKLMQKLAEKPAEKVIEKEVVATNANDELIKSMIEEQKAMREMIKQLAEKPAQIVAPQPQIIEKVVEKPVEKIVEKVVEKPVEKIVEKEVRVEVPVEKVVEKVVEKEVKAEVPVQSNVISKEASHNVISREVAGGAEKSKQVKTAPKKAPTPRLTLAEAYAQLTKEQKKFFDGLREYAMKKDSKCKEKLATYFTTIGPSTTNPLIKLTIKKGITVALFKMEDEYLKDIRRNASSDGAKVKVKETEISIPDAQSYDTAKDMVDLRVDQIERYEDYLKEQRAMKRK